jgi:hypothetical protein
LPVERRNACHAHVYVSDVFKSFAYSVHRRVVRLGPLPFLLTMGCYISSAVLALRTHRDFMSALTAETFVKEQIPAKSDVLHARKYIVIIKGI